jgi:hypothetical protein
MHSGDGVGSYWIMKLVSSTARIAPRGIRKEVPRLLLVADPTVLERLSKTLARRQAERDDAINRAATAEYEGPGADRASQLLTRMRRFFGLGSDPMGRG